MKYEIRELSISGILDQAFKVLMDNFGVLIAIACLLQLPLALFSTFVMSSFQFDPNDPTSIQALGGDYFVMLGVILLASLIVTPITNAAMVNAIADAYLGHKPNVGGSFSRALGRIGPLIWTWFLVVLAIMGGLILFIIPGILCMIWFALATQVVVLEPESGFGALQRSKALMRGNAGKWFVLMILLAAIGFGIGIATQLVASLTGSFWTANLLNSLSQILASLLAGAVLVVFYFSARCSNENFDLELLASSVGESAGERPSWGEEDGHQS